MKIKKKDLIHLIREVLNRDLEEDFSKNLLVKRMSVLFNIVEITKRSAIFSRSFGECVVELTLFPDGEEDIWIDKIETFDLDRKTNKKCLRKGYASKVLSILTKLADRYEIILSLIAAPEPWQKSQYPSLPDKDNLAAFYSRFGFEETSRNHAQVYMSRDPIIRE